MRSKCFKVIAMLLAALMLLTCTGCAQMPNLSDIFKPAGSQAGMTDPDNTQNQGNAGTVDIGGATNTGTNNSGSTNTGTGNTGTNNSGSTNTGTGNTGTNNSGSTNTGTGNSGSTTQTPPPALDVEAEVLGNADAAIPNITTAVASGTKVKSNNVASIDYSNTDDGYVMVQYTATTSQRLKVRVQGPVTTYTYNLTPQKWEAFPLSDENGTYKITVYRNVEGTSYAAVLSLEISVTMEDEFAPFIRSNQYVNFDAAPMTVSKAASLAGGMSDPLSKVQAIYNFVVNNMTYDYDLAASVTSGYLPDLDSVLNKMSGICFDYAALMTGMLRSQGVPTKLVIGYAGDVYHAWINVYSESTGWIDGVIYFDGVSWNRMDPTFAANGGSGILDFIGNGTNYSAKYYY